MTHRRWQRVLWAVVLFLAVCSMMTGPARASKANPADLRGAEALTPPYKPPLPPPVHDFTELLWRYTTGGSVESTPAVADGVVYVGSADQHLYALDAASGEPALALPYRQLRAILAHRCERRRLFRFRR